MHQSIETHGYRAILKQALTERIARNRGYSLRAFARDIGLSPSRVTEILQGKDGLSQKKAALVAKKLAFSDAEYERFMTMVQAQSARSRVARQVAEAKLQCMEPPEERRLLLEDSISALTGWHHFAMIELFRLPQAHSDVSWAAERLGITPAEAFDAIERLKRIGLLEEKRGKIRPTGNRFTTTDDVPSRTIRTFHTAILNKALEAIDGQSIDERNFGASLFPVSSSKVAAIKEDLQTMRREIVRKYELSAADKGSDKDAEVYCISSQVFRITNKNHGNNSKENV